MAKRQQAEAEPVVLDLRLAEGTPGEAFAGMAKATDDGRLSIQQAKAVADILERRLHILDAEKFRQRLEAAEAMAQEMVRRSAALPAPAAQATVDADTSRWEAS